MDARACCRKRCAGKLESMRLRSPAVRAHLLRSYLLNVLCGIGTGGATVDGSARVAVLEGGSQRTDQCSGVARPRSLLDGHEALRWAQYSTKSAHPPVTLRRACACSVW